jgi:hypothetical protein
VFEVEKRGARGEVSGYRIKIVNWVAMIQAVEATWSTVRMTKGIESHVASEPSKQGQAIEHGVW